MIVTIDTLRADHVGAYGGPLETPAFDGLAAEGVLVEWALTPTPTTGPAHASLLTGLHPWRHGVLDNAVPLREGLPTLAGRLGEHGFTTAAFVSSYVLHPRFELDRGFDRYELVATEAAQWRGELRARFYARGETTVERALAWLEDVKRGEDDRFFLWVHLFDPHAPYRPPVRFLGPIGEAIALDGKTLPPGLAGREQLRQQIRAYRGEVRYVDAQLARLVERLRELDLLDDTALVVTADHGEGLGDHGLMAHGHNLYEELVRVPLALRGPGLPANRRLDGPVQLEDLCPTSLAWLGVRPPPDLDGLDLLPWLRGERDASPRRVATGRRKPYPNEPLLYFAWRPGRKWIGPLEGAGRSFDLARDPRERVGEEAPVPAELRARVADAHPAAPLDRHALDAQSRRALEALGYLDAFPD